jgi:hypothetical protein
LFSLSVLLVVNGKLATLDEVIEGDRILDLAEVVAKKKLGAESAGGGSPPASTRR